MNKLADNIRAAFVSLISNKLRAVLTTLGIGIGIASVIVLVSLGNSVQLYINKQFLAAGSDLIYIRPATIFSGLGANVRGQLRAATLTDKDLALVQDPFNVPFVKAVVPLLRVGRTISYGSNQTSVTVSGTTANYFETVNRTVASGRLFDDEDVDSNARVAVLGQTTVSKLFPSDSSPIGETIRIGDVPFRVIGTLQAAGAAGATDQDNLIVVPLSAAETHLQTGRSVSGAIPLSEIDLQAQSANGVDDIALTVTALLHNAHKIKAGEDDDFQVTTQKDFLNSLNGVISVLTIFLAIIGGVSLLVGGIGVMNIMLVTVTERTREIGLRKAVGARGSDVLFQFLTEAVVLCFVGGFAGLMVALLGTGAIRLLVPDLDAVISPQSIVLAVSVTTLIGLFFGIYPASRAAALSPIAALRYE